MRPLLSQLTVISSIRCTVLVSSRRAFVYFLSVSSLLRPIPKSFSLGRFDEER